MSENTPLPSEGSRLNFIWLVPLLALVIGGWLVLREHKEKGPLIEIAMPKGDGVEAGKTPLVFRGMIVGMVREVDLTEKLDGVVAKVQLEPTAASLAAEGSEFWVEHPEIGFNGVRGLETLLSGSRLHVRPSKTPGGFKTSFKVRAKAPAEEIQTESRIFVLVNERLGSLNPGTAVYFRDVKVGVVEQHRLSPDSTQVWIRVKIFEPFDKLVRPSTRFWVSGGLNMKVGLLGATMRTNSLEALVSGGVSFATPDEAVNEPVAEEGTHFTLAEEAEKAWAKWHPAIKLEDDAK